jgi:hypothetical protein
MTGPADRPLPFAAELLRDPAEAGGSASRALVVGEQVVLR